METESIYSVAKRDDESKKKGEKRSNLLCIEDDVDVDRDRKKQKKKLCRTSVEKSGIARNIKRCHMWLQQYENENTIYS